MKTNVLKPVVRSLIGLAFVALTACGGGGGDSAAPGVPATAEGVYGGALTGSTSTAFELLVLENGEFWTMYGNQSASQFAVAGFIQGTGTSSNGSFASSDAKDFLNGSSVPIPVAVNATFNAADKTIAGSAKYSNMTAGFSGGPIAGSLYDYNAKPAMSQVAGAWLLNTTSGQTTLSIDITAGGVLSGHSSDGCNFTGTVSPRPSGKNVFNLSMTFAATMCSGAGTTSTGIVLAYPLSSGKTQLLVAMVNASRQSGGAAFGTR